ncbi:8-amino-7-oxononanoate synthase family protein [Rhizorhabdus sp. FW153]|uniref:8-amino-7-oxononanoate synthase family protein n=1 Tax=Rhizorhabdus sp. FW153 TaxID=3400216 RepID=UPI003CEAC275
MHTHRNGVSAVSFGAPAWEVSKQNKVIDIRTDYVTPNIMRRADGHEFVNLCSCSYLGLHSHPEILEGAITAILNTGALDLPISRIRLRLNLLEEFEDRLTALFGARCLSAVTSSAATAGVLPLIASGHMSPDGTPPVMLFDRHAHFSMDYIRPICADETEVIACRHNDLEQIEDACRKHKSVAYVCDGVYSMGGVAPIAELLSLQDRYGLFLFIDDSHSLSLHGAHGEGYARSIMREVNERTIIVASLGKAFGGSGGVIMLGPTEHEDILTRFGGPLAWSQGLNVPGIGAGIASSKLHDSPELSRRQAQLRRNMALFDSLIATEQADNGFPLKVIAIGDEDRAVAASARLFEAGYYSSAVFFPIVKRGAAGLRIMLRADNTEADIRGFAQALTEILQRDLAPAPARVKADA